VEGYIDEYRHPKVVAMVNGVAIDAVVDTGFDGDLCLPIEVAIQLGLNLCDTIEVELADGTRKRELVFTGEVKLGDKTKKVGIMLTESEEGLLGTQMFSRMGTNFNEGTVKLE
jgi:clan AA aspartic protease